MSKAKWEHKHGFSYLTGNRCSLRVHFETHVNDWCVTVRIGDQWHHEYYEHNQREKVLRHARVLFNAIEGKS